MDEMTQAINAVTSPAVRMWMNWMIVIFLISILFIRRYPAARVVLVAFVLSAVLGFIIFKVTKEPFLIGFSHVLVWIPLAIYLLRKVVSARNFKSGSMFGIWIILLLITIAISVVFDVRDIAQVFFNES